MNSGSISMKLPPEGRRKKLGSKYRISKIPVLGLGGGVGGGGGGSSGIFRK